MKVKFTITIYVTVIFILQSCTYFSGKDKKYTDTVYILTSDSLKPKPAEAEKKDSFLFVIDTVKMASILIPDSKVQTNNVHPQEVVEFAKTLIGIPYLYGSTDPNVGFDCSGFITYVFNHFKILVPRSSIDFTNVGKTITMENAKPGDLILFTGTDSTEKFVGHMGLIVSNENDLLEFIHSTSGKKYGVTITPLSDYYRGRYVKTVRIFPEND